MFYELIIGINDGGVVIMLFYVKVLVIVINEGGDEVVNWMEEDVVGLFLLCDLGFLL